MSSRPLSIGELTRFENQRRSFPSAPGDMSRNTSSSATSGPLAFMLMSNACEQELPIRRNVETAEFVVTRAVRRHEIEPHLVAAWRERNVIPEFSGPPVLKQERPARPAYEAAVASPLSAADEVAVGSPAHAGVVDDFAAAVTGHHVKLGDRSAGCGCGRSGRRRRRCSYRRLVDARRALHHDADDRNPDERNETEKPGPHRHAARANGRLRDHLVRRRIRRNRELRHVRTGGQGNLQSVGPIVLFVDLPELLAQAMHFDAHHGVGGGIELLVRPSEHLGGDGEFGKLLFLVEKMFRAQVLEQSARPRASAQKLDGPLQFLSFCVARIHIGRCET